MGISRSASVVIAYAMKAYGWDFKKSFEYVQKKRTCIKPNQNFITQLETYQVCVEFFFKWSKRKYDCVNFVTMFWFQGILDAMKNKEKLQRSKSETNLKSSLTKSRFRAFNKKKREREEHNRFNNAQQNKNEKSNNVVTEPDYSISRVCSGVELAQLSLRPKSWSPDNLIASEIFNNAGTYRVVACR